MKEIIEVICRIGDMEIFEIPLEFSKKEIRRWELGMKYILENLDFLITLSSKVNF
jgi:hypothetical protein